MSIKAVKKEMMKLRLKVLDLVNNASLVGPDPSGNTHSSMPQAEPASLTDESPGPTAQQPSCTYA